MKDNPEIEFVTANVYEYLEQDEYRYIFYRIKPNELCWFKRHFGNNPWKQLYKAKKYSLDYDNWFTQKDWFNEICHLKTLKDVQNYIEKQEKIYSEIKNELLKKQEIWPDDVKFK